MEVKEKSEERLKIIHKNRDEEVEKQREKNNKKKERSK